MGYVVFFNQVSGQDTENIGQKALNLSLLLKNGFKVPPGFIISKNAFDAIKTKDFDITLNKLLRCPEENLYEACSLFQKHIKSLEFPEKIADDIIEAYLSLSINLEKNSAESLLNTEEVFIAARSSFIDQNLKSQKTILNIKGKERLFKSILECYASSFSPEFIKHRKKNNFAELPMGVIIQKMIESQKAGVAYSVNPESKKKSEVLINACFGLGSGISTGSVFPDYYTVDRKDLSIKEIRVNDKKNEYFYDSEINETRQHSLGKKSFSQVLYDTDITEIARLVKKISSTFGKEQEIEWAIMKNQIYILGAKDIHSQDIEKVEMEIYENEDMPNMIDVQEEDSEELSETELEKNIAEEIRSEPEPKNMVNELEVVDIDDINNLNKVKESQILMETENIASENLDMVPDNFYIEERQEAINNEEDLNNEAANSNEGFIFSNAIQESSKENEKLDGLSEKMISSGMEFLISYQKFKTRELKNLLKNYLSNIPENFNELIDEAEKLGHIQGLNELRMLGEIISKYYKNRELPNLEKMKSILKNVCG